MQKNWHILYVKPGSEKKTAALLVKRKVECFLPVCYKDKKNIPFGKTGKEPLFKGYVFVYFRASQLPLLVQKVGALSVVFWKGKPATVLAEDVEAIKDFIRIHEWIDAIPLKIDAANANATMPSLVVNETLFTSIKHSFHVNLPSLGYMLVAKGADMIKVNTVIKSKTDPVHLN